MAGRNIDIGFWIKTSLRVLIVLLLPVEVTLEVDEGIPLGRGIGGSYSCMLFFIRIMHYTGETIASFRSPADIATALFICIPGIYFTRRLSKQSRTLPITDLVLASVSGTAFFSMYSVYGDFGLGFTLETLRFTSVALVVFVFLPMFAREAELAGLVRILEKNSTNRTSSSARVPRKYAVIGNTLGLAVFVIPFFLVVVPQVGQYSRYQTLSMLIYPIYQDHQMLPIWDLSILIMDINVLLLSFGYVLPRFMFIYEILRYWRGAVSRTRVILFGTIGLLFVVLLSPLLAMGMAQGEQMLYAPLPILLVIGVLSAAFVKPSDVDASTLLTIKQPMSPVQEPTREAPEDIDVPVLYSLKSRVIRLLTRIRQTRQKPESDHEEEAS
ncbi:MAG: hypothetical protein ACE5H4_13470 [Candidatus Thorarchaeota archaeon]